MELKPKNWDLEDKSDVLFNDLGRCLGPGIRHGERLALPGARIVGHIDAGQQGCPYHHQDGQRHQQCEMRYFHARFLR